MAYCPKCRGVLDPAATICPHCGYDFPLGDPETTPPHRDFAHSTLANIALIVGMVAAGFGCAAAVVGEIIALGSADWGKAFVEHPLTFFLCLAMLVVFVRVQEI